eukprot:scaffold38330_cov31-Tisochrysis_lutea.AAC.2
MDVLEAHAQSLAKRLAQALEGREAEEQATPPSLEDALLEGSDAPPPRGALLGAPAELSSAAEAQQLRADLAEVLKQRSQLRAKLIAEQERRQHAEAELVALGAQWHGTDTARALQRRAEEEAQRKLDAQVAKVARSYEQRRRRRAHGQPTSGGTTSGAQNGAGTPMEAGIRRGDAAAIDHGPPPVVHPARDSDLIITTRPSGSAGGCSR